jgi:hypothetical protein
MKHCPEIILISVLCFFFNEVFAQDSSAKPRTIVTTDGEVDDVDSFIRMLLYTNEFEVAGLIYSSSQWHYSGDGKGTKFISEMASTKDRYGERTELRWPGTSWMEHYIGKYKLVYPQLDNHAKGFPTAEHLLSLIHIGNIEFEGEMAKDTKGSEHIKKILLDNDPRPVYLQIWGGTNTVARALKSIEDQYSRTPDWKNIYNKVTKKAILYTVLDQDATYKKYISKSWPDIRVYYNSDQFWSFAYLWPRVVPDSLKKFMNGAWFSQNIIKDHGPLLSEYYTWGDERQLPGDPEHTHGDMKEVEKYKMSKYDFISEGDSPAYLFLVDVGLGSLEDPSYGGWGGRMVRSTTQPNRWEDGEHVKDLNSFTGQEDKNFPQTRWIAAIQNDFAARADWCVADFDNANHPPQVSVTGSKKISGKPGETIKVSAKVTDPDKDALTTFWWQYFEADSYKGKITIVDSTATNLQFTIPKDAKPGGEIHVILEVTDSGSPALTRYQRVVVDIVK